MSRVTLKVSFSAFRTIWSSKNLLVAAAHSAFHSSIVSSSPSRLPHTIPTYLFSCLDAQKRAILYALQRPSDAINDLESDGQEEEDIPTNATAFQQLTNLLIGTTLRGEGNSCLLLGPRGSGKTRVGCSLFSPHPVSITQSSDC